METSQRNISLLSGCTWESQLEGAQMPTAVTAAAGGAAAAAAGPTASPTSRAALQDEIISVYEVFVKDDQENVRGGGTGKPVGVSVISALPPGTSHHRQIIQGECAPLDLDAIDIISVDGGDVADLEELDDVVDEDDEAALAANAVLNEVFTGDENNELEAPQSAASASEENMVVASGNTAEQQRPSSASARLIDKDDPRSRLHYVKYLKRDGKTLKIWECGICSKEFRHQYTLMRHLPTHTDERNFKCDACGKAFRQLSTLSQHKAIHSDARPYICEFCKKTFNRVSTLISHRKTHSEHKPHKCHLCGKGFHQKGNLRNHIFTHTNERPYKCDLCGKGFNQMSNLVCHKVKAHAHAEKMQYTCGICGKEFPRRFSLRSHEEYKHGIKYRQTPGVQTAPNEGRTTRSKSARAAHPPEDEQQNCFSDSRDKDMNMTEFMENIIIDKIETKAMETAVLQGQTPFALFKPAKGIPVLVKVAPSGSLNHLLTPATADDLKMSGKMDSSSTQLSDIDGSKSVQIKVPVVATITEKIEDDGKTTFVIEPPGPDQEQDSLLTPVDSVSEVLPTDCEDDYSQVEQLPSQQSPTSMTAAAAAAAAAAATASTSAAVAAAASTATDDELLELAAKGGIQFVRATDDGRYEVMTNSEARDLMAQNSHDVKILGTEETEAIISVPAELEYIPTVQELQQQNQQQHQQLQLPEIILPDSDGIMVLDPNNDQKALTLRDIEILGDKELRQLLDARCLENRSYTPDASDVTYLSQAKIDEILNAKPISIDTTMSILDENINPGTSQNELSSILNHRSELPAITASSLYARNSQQLQLQHQQQQPPSTQQHQQQPYPLSMLHEPSPLTFLKSTQSFTDELSAILDEDSSPPVIDYSTLSEYNPRLKLSEFEDDPESIFLTLGTTPTSGPRIIGQRAQGMQPFDVMGEKPQGESMVGRAVDNPIRLTEDRAATNGDFAAPYEDFRFLNAYDQIFKNSMYDSHFSSYNPLSTPLSTFISDIDGMKKDIQILERTLESKFYTPEDYENKENDRQFKVLDQMSTEGSYGQNGSSAIANVLSSVENLFDREPEKVKMDTGNFLQACSPCGSADFLYFENRLAERDSMANSPSRSSLERSSQHEREINAAGLPDLDC